MWKKAMVYLGLTDDEEFDSADYDPYGDFDEEPASQRRTDALRSTETPTVRPIMREDMVMPTNRPAMVRPIGNATRSVHVLEPAGFNDAQEVGDYLKEGQPVILNMAALSKELQRRLIDFSSGLTYAIGGSMSRVADQVFLLTPANVEVSEEERERLSARGYARA